MRVDVISAPPGWDEEALATLRASYAANMSYSEIAALIGKSRSAVAGKALRLGLKRDGAGVKTALSLGARSSPPIKQASIKQTVTKEPKPADSARRPTAKAAPDPVVGPVDAGAAAEAVLALARGQCRWPIGEPDRRGFTFCSATAGAGSAYCGDHHARAWRPVPKPDGVSRPARRLERWLERRVWAP